MAFRHPRPEWPEPFDTLSPLGEEGLEQICTGLVNHVYPESAYTPSQRERMLAASRQRFVDGLRNKHAQFRTEVVELQTMPHAEAERIERRIAEDPCNDESCKVLSAHYIVAIMRRSGVLRSRRELQEAGLLEYDCPVCQETLGAGDGVVAFHVLECGHRVHKECMLGIDETLTIVGAVRKCPLCRRASLAPRTFERRGALS